MKPSDRPARGPRALVRACARGAAAWLDRHPRARRLALLAARRSGIHSRAMSFLRGTPGADGVFPGDRLSAEEAARLLGQSPPEVRQAYRELEAEIARRGTA
jgi:hypothetical protein